MAEDSLTEYMALALEVSKRALPACLPNPPVGCILVEASRVVAQGFTQPPGEDHAEAMALRLLGDEGSGIGLHGAPPVS